MKQKVNRSVTMVAVAAMLAGPAPSLATQGGRKGMTAAEANAQSAKAQQDAMAAAAAAQAERDAAAARLATETPAQKKAREKAEKLAAKSEAKRIKDADRAAHPRKSSAAANCVAGAVIGGILAILSRNKSAGNIVASAVGGCAAGWALGEALKGKDEEKLNRYIGDDYMERDDIGTTAWNAPESGQPINIETVGESYKSMQQTVSLDPSLAFDPANTRVSRRKMRVIRDVPMRIAPTATADSNGRFGAGDIVLTYGSTTDLQWTYVAERQADGAFLVIGYVPTADLSASLTVPSTQMVTVAKPKPPVRVARKAPVRRGTKPTAVAAAPTPAVYAPPKTVTFAAMTRCKNIRVSAMGKTGGTQEKCGGAANIA